MPCMCTIWLCVTVPVQWWNIKLELSELIRRNFASRHVHLRLPESTKKKHRGKRWISSIIYSRKQKHYYRGRVKISQERMQVTDFCLSLPESSPVICKAWGREREWEQGERQNCHYENTVCFNLFCFLLSWQQQAKLACVRCLLVWPLSLKLTSSRKTHRGAWMFPFHTPS